jgi:hypothetical protein
VALAREFVEDHAGDRHILSVTRKAERDRGGGLRLSADIEHQHHGPSGRRRDIGGRAVAPGAGRGNAVEQSHDALGQHEISVVGDPQQRLDPAARLRPGIEIERCPAGGDGVKRRVDIIRSAFIGLHDPAAPSERGEQRQGQRRLAAAAGGRGDDQAGRISQGVSLCHGRSPRRVGIDGHSRDCRAHW